MLGNHGMGQHFMGLLFRAPHTPIPNHVLADFNLRVELYVHAFIYANHLLLANTSSSENNNVF